MEGKIDVERLRNDMMDYYGTAIFNDFAMAAMNVEFIDNLLGQRREKYLSVADVIVETDHKSTDEICDEIIAKLIAFDREKEAKGK